MSEYCVTVDNRQHSASLRLNHGDGFGNFMVRNGFIPRHYTAEIHHPQTLRARFWRWILGA